MLHATHSRGAITYAMLLGTVELPKPVVRGEAHETSHYRKKVKEQRPRRETTEIRRAEIVAMIEEGGPMSRSQIRDELSMPTSDNTVRADTVALCEEGILSMKVFGQTFIYYLAKVTA